MTASYIQVPPDSTGKKLLTLEHDISASNIQCQVYHIADADNPLQIQRVDERGQGFVRFAEGSPTMDAFGGLRVSNSKMIGSYEYTNGDMADLFTDYSEVGGSIEYRPIESQTVLSVTSTIGSLAERSTNRYHYYQPGVGNLIILTLALNDNGKAGNMRSWGYGDHENGLFFVLNGTQLQVMLRSSSLGGSVTTTATGTTGQYTITVADSAGIQVGQHANGAGILGYTEVVDVSGNVVTLDKANHATVSGEITFVNIYEEIVNQQDWNGDRLDGTGLSGMDIDLTKANFFWIDFAWLGVGAVRFGVLAEDGSRWVCHTFNNPNTKIGAYMATGSLPLHFHNENYGNTSGDSLLKLICSAVYSEAQTDYTFWRFSDVESPLLPVGSTSYRPIVSLKPKVEYAQRSNRIGIYPDQLSVYVSGGPVKITIFDDATITKDSAVNLSHNDWNSGEESVFYTHAATEISGGTKFRTFYLDTGSHNIDLSPFYELNDEGYHVLYDGTSSQLMTVAAAKINNGDTVSVAATVGYRELR